MGFYRGPKIVTDGLIMYYDTDNVKSYVGEPTTNLLYNSGATNLSTANDIYGRCVKTYMGDLTYKFVNNGTGSSTIRLYVNLGDLTNTFSYGCSIYYKELTIGTISFDWCDTTITGGVNSSSLTSNRLYGMGTRSTYDGTFRFLDINLDSGASVILYGDQIEYKSHVTPFVSGVRSNTQGLLSLVKSNTVANLSNMSYDSVGNLSYSGTNYIDCGINCYNLGIVRNATFSGWVYPISQMFTTVISDFGSNSLGMALRITSSTVAEFYVYPNNYRVTYNGTFSFNTWYNLVGVMSENNLYIYLNGLLVASSTLSESIGNSNATLKIGARGDGAAPNLGGKMPIVTVHNRALSSSEVLQNFNTLKNRFGL